MNEYTRREEIRWTLVTVFILVPAVATAIVTLVLAKGPMVTDPAAIQAEQAAVEADDGFRACSRAATKLSEEVSLFQDRVETAREDAKKKLEAEGKKAKGDVEFDIPWSAAAPVYKQAKVLHENDCQQAAQTAAGKDKKATKAWVSVHKAGKIKDPGKSDKAQQAAAEKLLDLFEKAPVDDLKKHAADAKTKLADARKKATEHRENALVQAPLPTGLFPRGAAIGVGVGVSLIALIISYISVRSASMRRAQLLVSLRRFANTPEAGLQAAAIVRLAAHHNGGEPGMVVGSALGGLLAAVVSPTNDPNVFIADLFVAGSMGGLLVGLASQWLVRTLTGVNKWRERTKELGDIEKPSIPIALVLGAVTPGLEKQFLRHFEALPVAEAATVVQKLAAQAEEQILAAADMAAQQQMAQQGYGQPMGQPGQPPMGGGYQ